jgi:hypothetical protein
LGEIVGRFSDVIGAIEHARDAAKTFRDGMALFGNGAGLAGILSMASGIAGIATAAIAAGRAIAGMFRDVDHEKVNDLRDVFLNEFGVGKFVGFNELAKQLNALGPAGDAMFQRLINAKKVDEFNAAMQAVREALKKAGEASTQFGDDTVASTNKAKAALDAMAAELKGLYDSIADEAPEEEMGVIERNTRARIAQIEEEQRAREDANEDAADHLQQVLSEREFVARLKFDYELPEGLTVRGESNVPGFASGTKGQYLDFGAGTLAMLHGKERVVTEAEGRAGAVGGDDGYAPIHVQVGEETLIKAIVKVRKRLRLHV